MSKDSIKKKKPGNSLILVNKKASFDFEIIKKYTAGIAASGVMVKKILLKEVNLNGKYIIYQGKKLQIIGLGNDKYLENLELLLGKSQIKAILKEIVVEGISCIPLSIFRQKRWLKCEIAVVKGKTKYDKKNTLKEKDIKREIARNML